MGWRVLSLRLSGLRGFVKGMNMMSTELKQLDNTRVVIPNGKVWNNPIINITRMPTQLIVLESPVSYNTVISDAVSVALKAAETHPKIHSDPEPIVRFKEMADSAVTLQPPGMGEHGELLSREVRVDAIGF